MPFVYIELYLILSYSVFCRINISEVHRMYQLLEEEDNIKFMTMIEASEQNNVNTTQKPEHEKDINTSKDHIETKDTETNIDQNQVLIKTETRTGYVNIDGTEREKATNETLRDIVKDSISNYQNKHLVEQKQEPEDSDKNTSPIFKEPKVDVDDIIVQQKPVAIQPINPPSTTKSKDTFKMLPKVIQDFLNSDWKSRPKCEPQKMLEKIRKEKLYPDHPDVHKYKFLMTPAPSFLQRISLAGEFLNKKQLLL